jgi:hypothetical protein
MMTRHVTETREDWLAARLVYHFMFGPDFTTPRRV